MFGKKSPSDKWRKQNPVGAAFADHSGWDVHFEFGVVHTVIDGVPVTVLAHHGGGQQVGVIIEAGTQAERTLTNTIGDDGGEPFEFDGWRGAVAPGSGLLEGGGIGGPNLYDRIMAAAIALASRVRQA